MKEYFELIGDERGVATLTIVRAGKLNLLCTPVIENLIAGLRRAALDTSTRVMVLTGSGEHAFIGGADIKEMVSLEPASARRFITRLHDLCEAIRTFPVPVVARIQGWCLGAGLEVAAACDVRVAASTAHFAMPEVKMDIPSVIHAALLPRLIGSAHARWLMITGETIDAHRAFDWGLVDVLADEGKLDAAVEHTVVEMLSCGPEALRTQKALLNAWDEFPLSRGIQMSIEAFGNALVNGEPMRYMNEFLTRRRGNSQ